MIWDLKSLILCQPEGKTRQEDFCAPVWVLKNLQEQIRIETAERTRRHLRRRPWDWQPLKRLFRVLLRVRSSAEPLRLSSLLPCIRCRPCSPRSPFSCHQRSQCILLRWSHGTTPLWRVKWNLHRKQKIRLTFSARMRSLKSCFTLSTAKNRLWPKPNMERSKVLVQRRSEIPTFSIAWSRLLRRFKANSARITRNGSTTFSLFMSWNRKVRHQMFLKWRREKRVPIICLRCNINYRHMIPQSLFHIL